MATKSKINVKNLLPLFIFSLILFSCEESFDPDFADDEPTVVIEGYIQAGEGALPTYVTISKTYPLFQNGDPVTPQQFLGGANVTVSDGETTAILSEICTANLDPEIKDIVLETLGIDTILPGLDFCLYADLFMQLQPEEGKTYELNILFEGKNISGTTSIPSFIPIDSLKVYNQFNLEGFRQLNASISDPLGPNYYRLKASVDGSAYKADFSSVTDDVLFNGKSFDFPINKPTPDNTQDFDPNTAGLFAVGDSVSLQWQILDQAHFDFWNTLEFARGNQGPFSSYSRATSNLDGAIGIWGGSSIRYYDVFIE